MGILSKKKRRQQQQKNKIKQNKEIKPHGRGVTHRSSHTKNVDVQRNGGVVAYIHIGNAVIHHHVLETVTFASPWKREKRKRNKIQLGGLGG